MAERLRVLIVEDCEDDAVLIVRELTRGGFDVQWHRVETSAAMASALDAGDWDLILADYSLPRFSGEAALALAQQRALDVPFIVVSGTIGEETAVAMMKAGADDYLVKNNLARLAPAVERELEEAETRREVRHAERALCESEERFRDVAHGIPGLVYQFEVGPDGSRRLQYLSDGFERLYGLPREQAMADVGAILDRVLPEDRAALQEAFAGAAPRLGTVTHEYRIRRPDGEVRWLRSAARARPLDAGGTLWTGVTLDVTERKRAEEERDRTRTLLLEAERVTGVGGWELDILTGRATVSDEWRRIHGVEAEQADLERLMPLVHPDDLAAVRRAIRETCTRGTPYEMEHRIVRRSDGEVRVVRASGTVVCDEDGRPVRVYGASQDITEGQRAHEALRESEARFRTLFDAAPDGIYLLDAEGTFVDGNRAAERLTGHDKADLLGRTFASSGLLSPDQMLRAVALFRESAAGRPTGPDEFVLNCKDGSTVTVEIRTTPVTVGGQGLILGIARDVTERKRAEEALRRSESLYADAQRVAHVGHWELVPEVGTPRWSPEIFRIFGLDPAGGEPSFADHQKYIHPDDWPRLEEAVGRASPDGTPFDLQFRIVRPDGRVRWMHAIGTTEKDAAGRVTRVFGTAQDVTDLKRAEEAVREHEARLRDLAAELVQAEERERRRLAANLHDFVGQALTGAKLALQDVEQRAAADPALAGGLRRARGLLTEAIDHTRTTVFDLSPPILYELGFEAALESLVERFEADYGLAVALEADGEGRPLGEALRTALYRSVRELLHNVVRHSGADRAAVGVRHGGDRIEIRVRDNGTGFDPEAEAAAPHAGRAGGFGLFEIRERLDYLGGSADIRSEPGKGTCVTLTAPLPCPDPGREGVP
jgi:PAS domain S-box-containing protein